MMTIVLIIIIIIIMFSQVWQNQASDVTIHKAVYIYKIPKFLIQTVANAFIWDACKTIIVKEFKISINAISTLTRGSSVTTIQTNKRK